jgi:galactoside O-acetyltransferase
VRRLARWAEGVRQERARGQFARSGAGGQLGTGLVVLGGERIELGDGVRVMTHVQLWATATGAIHIGDRTYVGDYTHIVSNGDVRIGKDVLIAPFCYIQDTDHGFDLPDLPIAAQASKTSPIVVEDDVWIAAHTVITRGVRIGRGAVIGANSVVTHDVEPGAIVAGSPARPIGSRSSGS